MTLRRSARIVSAFAVIALVAACATDPEDSESGGDSTDAAEDWEPEFVDGELQPLPDGFPDRPITIVNVDEAGSRDGIYARTVDEALSGISPVDVVVSDEPSTQGGTVPTVADVQNREGGPEYYPIIASVGGTATDFLVEPIEQDLGIGLDDINFLIATEVHPYIIVQRADAPWGTGFAEFVEYAQAHPGELRYISQGVGAGQDIWMEWIMDALEIEVEKIPAAGADEAVAAVAAGEGDFSATRPDVASAAEETGRANIIFFSSEDVPDGWTDKPGVQSAKDYESYGLPDATWGVVLGFMLPADVDELHARWLYSLFEAAYETDVYQQRLDTVAALQIQLRTTEEANDLARTIYDFADPIVRAVGLHWEDN
jgi:tripartite-type tricarboxylate transporter receptor subunit TctC